LRDLLPIRNMPSFSDDKLIQMKSFQNLEMDKKSSEKRRSNMLIEIEVIQLSTHFNTFNKIFIHLNVRALLMYKTKDSFQDKPHEPWIVIPVEELLEVKIINVN